MSQLTATGMPLGAECELEGSVSKALPRDTTVCLGNLPQGTHDRAPDKLLNYISPCRFYLAPYHPFSDLSLQA